MTPEEKLERQREYTRQYRARRIAAGLPVGKPLTEDQKRRKAEKIAARRAAAKAAGEKLPSDRWAAENPEAHRARVARWRTNNAEKATEISRQAQKRRRETPWGTINNRLWPVMMNGVRCNSAGSGQYATAVGYSWSMLREHLEAQFTPEMNWDNWGSVWELDHIKPLSMFRYESLLDPLFREAWQLSNLRPLLKHENAAKGSKYQEAERTMNG